MTKGKTLADSDAPSSSVPRCGVGSADVAHDSAEADRLVAIPYRPPAYIDELLEGIEDAVLGGARDGEIARCFYVRPQEVRAWRRRRNLPGNCGRPTTRQPRSPASRGVVPPRLRRQRALLRERTTAATVFVERDSLDYLVLGRLTTTLLNMGWGTDEVALGTGISDTEVAVAYEYYRDLQPTISGLPI
jgi:hypothetical protein